MPNSLPSQISPILRTVCCINDLLIWSSFLRRKKIINEANISCLSYIFFLKIFYLFIFLSFGKQSGKIRKKGRKKKRMNNIVCDQHKNPHWNEL